MKNMKYTYFMHKNSNSSEVVLFCDLKYFIMSFQKQLDDIHHGYGNNLYRFITSVDVPTIFEYFRTAFFVHKQSGK